VNDLYSSSTWIHIQTIVNLACWCSPAFSVHVSKLVTRYHSGQLTTEESIEAAATLNASMRPVENEETAPTAIVPASSPSHRLVRTNARKNSRRGPVRDIPIPRHLFTSTGVYIGAWGIVDEDASDPFWHLKVGKATEQSVTMRVKAHYAEKPYTFVLLYVAGCDGGSCYMVEAKLKHTAARVLGLDKVGSSDEEFKVPIDALESTVVGLSQEIERRHRDVLCLASDTPPDLAIEKQRMESNERKFKYAFDRMMEISDEQARSRAIELIMRA
jgi:hypothetical protein